MYNLFGIRIRIEHQTLNTVFSQFADDIDDFGITNITDVFFKRQAEHKHFRALDRLADPDQLFHGIFGDELAHIIVDAAPGKNDFRVVTGFISIELRENARRSAIFLKACPN